MKPAAEYYENYENGDIVGDLNSLSISRKISKSGSYSGAIRATQRARQELEGVKPPNEVFGFWYS